MLPLVQPLADYFLSLPASDNPDAYIFPRAASAKRTSTLSNQFRGILVAAGLVEPRNPESMGKGRSHAREPSELSFHGLRHSAVTMLKAAGLSDFIAREIVGARARLCPGNTLTLRQVICAGRSAPPGCVV